MRKNGLLILDFGSQVSQLIARRFRELGIYCELLPYTAPLEKIKESEPIGIVLSGGPQSVHEEGSPRRNVRELREIAPVMGICYGMQLMAHDLGGKVASAKVKEYGRQIVHWEKTFKHWPQNQEVWMSHGDVVETPPAELKIVAKTPHGHAAALEGDGFFAVQFHPEVSHTQKGEDILKYFAFQMCGAKKNWETGAILKEMEAQIRHTVGDNNVLVGLSGGVDSTVLAYFLTKVLGKERVHCVFVDNGLLRLNEAQKVLSSFENLNLNVHFKDASQTFLSELKGVSDPEQKRKTIGRVFIEVFEKAVRDLGVPISFLAQGTLYPDVIESVSPRGGSVTIKSHHNVGGLPEKMNLKLLEPFRELFKDEVRHIGEELGLPPEILGRHPFPGPGLAVRVLGEITAEKLETLKQADDIFVSELMKHNIYNDIWQAFVVLLPVQTVGVQGDNRTYANVASLRAVTSRDGMTADWFPFESSFLAHVSNRITNEVEGINRVVYDVTSKPPGTIEWE
jgi:GMP synthase (glutamine-hydrolysing)